MYAIMAFGGDEVNKVSVKRSQSVGHGVIVQPLLLRIPGRIMRRLASGPFSGVYGFFSRDAPVKKIHKLLLREATQRP
jgi:hypothetical protein